MKTKQENIFNKYLDTKQKKITAVIIAGVLIIGCASAVILNTSSSKELVLTSDTVKAEFGQKVSTNIADYLDTKKSSNADKVIKDTEEKDDLKYVTVTNKDENGNVISKEEKDYPKVGNYEISFTYKKEKATVKVSVKDTTKPEIEAPESIDVIQYTDLSTFNFGELLKATDYSDVKDWKIDTSKVDVNTIGSYGLKVSIEDKYKNKATKKLKVNVVEAPALAEGEVAVTEVVVDENGNAKTVITKKASNDVSANDAVASTSPVLNKETVKSDATNASPTTNSGVSKPATNTNNSTSSSSTDSNNNTGNSSSSSGNSGGNASKPSNSNANSSKPSSNGGSTNTGNKTDNSSSKPKPSAHTHNFNIPVTKVVHHDAETKTVHHDAVVENQPVYEEHLVCKVCGQDFGRNEIAMGEHSAIYGHSYHVTDVQVGTKQVTVKAAYDETVIVKQAYDETVTTGYKCSCGAVK